VREPYAHLLHREDGTPLVPGLGDQRDRRPVQVVAELLEGVEVGVRPEQPQPGALHGGGEAGLRGGALRSGLGEPGGEGHRELHLGLGEFLDHGKGIGDQQHSQVDLFG
jgi:hypothetical protein